MKMAPFNFSYTHSSYLEWTGRADWARNSTNHIDDSIAQRCGHKWQTLYSVSLLSCV